MKRFSLLILIAIAFACEDQPSTGDLVKDMVVQTNYDNAVDFRSFTTYAMPMDTIGLVSNASDNSAIVNNYSKAVTRAVKENFDALGYQQVDIDDNPDFGVNVFVVNDLSVFQSVVYPNYYYGYPGYGYGSFYGYGGYYNYPYVSTSVYNQAILVIEFADLNTIQNNNARVVWTANMGDLITTVDQNGKVLEAIDQAFLQSPYLKK
jgi:Domain of unknown function (DUF4136)